MPKQVSIVSLPYITPIVGEVLPALWYSTDAKGFLEWYFSVFPFCEITRH